MFPSGMITLTLFALASAVAHPHVVASVERLRESTSTDVILVLKYTNTGGSVASIREADIPRTLPDGRLWSNTFHVVSSSGMVAPYTGVIVNLTPEARVARVLLQPGEEATVEVNLSENYQLMPDTRYVVTPRGFGQAMTYSAFPGITVNTDADVSLDPKE